MKNKNKGRSRRKAAPPKTKTISSAVVCAVCGVGDGKYKCPKCRAPFCCVQCSKDHKTNQCPATSDSANTLSTNAVAIKSGTCQTSEYVSLDLIKAAAAVRKRKRTEDEEDSDDDEPGFNITPEMKKCLEQSTWLRKELQDGGLRYLIGSIDAASDDEADKPNKQYSGKKNKHEDITPRVLALARSKSSHPKFASFIDNMLLTAGVLQPTDATDVDGQLSLVPVPRRSAIDNADTNNNSDSEDSSDDNSSDSEGSESVSSADESESSEEEGEILNG